MISTNVSAVSPRSMRLHARCTIASTAALWLSAGPAYAVTSSAHRRIVSRSPARCASGAPPERDVPGVQAAGRAGRPAGERRGRRPRPRPSRPAPSGPTTRSRSPSSCEAEVAERPPDVDDLGGLGLPQGDVVGPGTGRRSAPPAPRRGRGVARPAGQRDGVGGERRDPAASSVKASPTASLAIRCTRRAGRTSPRRGQCLGRAGRSARGRPAAPRSHPGPRRSPAPPRRAAGVARAPGQVRRLAVEHPRRLEVGRVEQRRAGPAQQPRAGWRRRAGRGRGPAGRAVRRPPRPGPRAPPGPPPRSPPPRGPGRRAGGPAGGARPPRPGSSPATLGCRQVQLASPGGRGGVVHGVADERVRERSRSPSWRARPLGDQRVEARGRGRPGRAPASVRTGSRASPGRGRQRRSGRAGPAAGAVATRRRMVPCAVSGTMSETAAPRAAASRAISETKSGLPAASGRRRRRPRRPSTAGRRSPRSARRRRRAEARQRPGLARRGDLPRQQVAVGAGGSSWSRQPQTTRTGRVASPGQQEPEQVQAAGSAQCRSSSSSTTGNSAASPSSTACTPSKSGNRLPVASGPPRRRGRRGSAARRARGPPSATRAWGSPAPAWRSTWVQTQNAGAPEASSAAAPRSTVAPARRARSPISARTDDLPIPASPRSQSKPPRPSRSTASSASARSRTADRPSSTRSG